MSRFRADLHIHSRFSRATSQRLTVANLAAWGRLKGLDVLGTGDITHPAWRAELREQLVEDDRTGLYRPRVPLNLTDELPEYLPPRPVVADAPGTDPLFVLQAEISSIYKKDGAVHKVHNLVFMPNFDSLERLCRKLEAIGNLHSDGRPILGLDSRNLLELVLETDNRGVLIPAHIWTPWFSLFGSRSGFDSVEACFGDLSHHIFALETGLSSDPDMNRLWSALDRYALISNSDCHSGENLGREANLFAGTPSYDGLFEALRRAAYSETPREDCRFLGTLEFFPEEGKYHLDGHRACNVVLEPHETRALNGLCPVCGRPLTVGVLHRVLELADRERPKYVDSEIGFSSLIPLPELIGELLGVGAKSGKVRARHAELLTRFGTELSLLMDVPEADLRRHWDDLGEAVARMRRGEVIREGGYDGEYGVVRVFTPAERATLTGKTPRARRAAATGKGPAPASPARKAPRGSMQGTLLLPVASVPCADLEPNMTQHRAPSADPQPCTATSPIRRTPLGPRPQPRKTTASTLPSATGAAQTGTPAPARAPVDTASAPAAPAAPTYTLPQLKAIKAGPQPILVIAGPGSGKTRTLVGRLARLLEDGLPAEAMVAVTFTRRAAAELRERLSQTLMAEQTAAVVEDGAHNAPPPLPTADTLHALALRHWPGKPPVLLGEDASRAAFASANPDLPASEVRGLWTRLQLLRERLSPPEPALDKALERYTLWKQARHQADYTDLLEIWLHNLLREQTTRPWSAVLVDEIQDLSPLQLALVQALLPRSGKGFFGIGDPDQAIYSFRGAHPDTRSALGAVWPGLELYTLSDSHRAGPDILEAASAVLGASSMTGRLHAARPLPATLHLFAAPDARQEARWVAERLATLLGWGGHTQLDHMAETGLPSGPCSPGEVAILVRTRTLMPLLREALDQQGIPCTSPETAPFWADQGMAVLLGLAAAHFQLPLGLPLPRPLPAPLPSVPDSYWQGDPRRIDPVCAALSRASNGASLAHNLAALANTPALAALTAAHRDYGGWPGLLDVVHMGQALDLVRHKAEQVQLMTLHASKGLEFRAVFLPALEDGLLPFFGAEHLLNPASAPAPNLDLLAEERRLLYVGITRASEAVFASHAARRTLYGRELTLPPSRLLAHLPASFHTSSLIRRSRTVITQMSLLG